MSDERLYALLEQMRLDLNKRVRADCWCKTTVKPCDRHDSYDDGICDLIELLEAHPLRRDNVAPSRGVK